MSRFAAVGIAATFVFVDIPAMMVFSEAVLGVLNFESESDAPSVFARHETFAPRPGWLKKGFDAASADREIFLSKDAAVRLGVGKNMARAIRYWCHAFKVLEDQPVVGRRAIASRPSALGQQLLGTEGWDPYLEDVASLWYLHWKLLQTPSEATAWRFAFTVFPEREFTVDELDTALQVFVSRAYPTSRVAASSLHKDALCIARMYCDAAGPGSVNEDSIGSPFTELGLVRPGYEPRSYLFDIGEKADLPALVIVAACLEFASEIAPGARTVALGRLLYEYGSPGMAFKLTESALVSAVEEVSHRTTSVSIADTAGLVQMAFSDRPEDLAQSLLEEHYAAARRAVGRIQ